MSVLIYREMRGREEGETGYSKWVKMCIGKSRQRVYGYTIHATFPQVYLQINTFFKMDHGLLS